MLTKYYKNHEMEQAKLRNSVNDLTSAIKRYIESINVKASFAGKRIELVKDHEAMLAKYANAHFSPEEAAAVYHSYLQIEEFDSKQENKEEEMKAYEQTIKGYLVALQGGTIQFTHQVGTPFPVYYLSILEGKLQVSSKIY